jgi:hypothetical protein
MFFGHELPVQIAPFDTVLTNVPIMKRGLPMPTVALSIVNYENLASGGWLVTAQGWVDGALKKACERLGGIALSQMHNRGLQLTGEVRSCSVTGGVARLVCRVGAEAEAVVQKIKHQVFPMIRRRTLQLSARCHSTAFPTTRLLP